MGGWHEEPAKGKSVLEDLGIDLPHATDSSSGLSGMTRASSTDSVSFLESEEDPARPQRQTLLVWPQSASPIGGVSSIDIYGSFTQPPWTVPLTLHLCPETGVWWISMEEALPRLQAGTYVFKFLFNDHVWMANPALPVSRSADGVENNKLRIDYRLLTRIDRKACSQTSLESSPRVSRPPTMNLVEGSKDSSQAVLEAVLEPSSRSSSVSVFGEDGKKTGRALPMGRRAVSTADRLDRAGSVNGLNRSANKRTFSLPLLKRDVQTGHKLEFLCDLVGGSDEGTLYDSDVALLLELPNVKRPNGLVLSSAAFYKPKDGAGEGEDGHFCGHPVLGVADGVGGLQHVLGYTSKAFADELMAQCKSVASGIASGKPCEPSEVAQRILCDGFMGVQKYGASTAAIAYLDTRTNRLGVAILGDSGVMVIRRPTSRCLKDADNRMTSTRSFIVFKSTAQQHDFNYPFQLCRLPQELKKLLIRRPDMPGDCMMRDVEVEEGDLVLVYSDGVYDNLHDDEVLDICDRALSPYAAHVLGLPPQAASPPELVSRAIGGAAYVRSLQENVRTPFVEEARKAGWPVSWCCGGKEDDITCVAAWIAHDTGSAAREPT
uniref:Protein phosphatase n=1 Tax=Alexandrium catenella TaxID=2925 RepID=A0A7S1WIM1_ALECA